MKAFIRLLIFYFSLVLTVYCPVEPQAGKWKTWVLPAGNAIALPPPQFESYQEELKTLLAIQTLRNESGIQKINYWNVGSPGYRLNHRKFYLPDH